MISKWNVLRKFWTINPRNYPISAEVKKTHLEEIMAVRTAQAEWNGTLREGSGQVRLGSGAFEGAFSFNSRFEDAPQTNPEELIGAAHAGCFSMALGAALERTGFPADRIRTEARVHLTKGESGNSISRIDLITEGIVPGINPDKFQELAETAKKNCIVSRALEAVPITLTAKLVG
jgi:osmotically inducible protein OsmC